MRSPRAGIFLAIALFLAAASPLLCCGPIAPNSILTEERSTLRTPILDFQGDLRRIPSPGEPPACALPGPNQASLVPDQSLYRPDPVPSLAIERAELSEVLAPLAPPERESILDAYKRLRLALSATEPIDPSLEIPPLLPEDVHLYLQGAKEYNLGQFPEAIATWKKLLDLPADQRRLRSTWAAWMIARTVREQQGLASALPWYEQCIQLSSDGFADSLRLGLSSLGWQARHALDQGDLRRALELYYYQARAGDPSGWDSLLNAIPFPDKLNDSALASAAADPFLRALITLRLLNFTSERYLDPASLQADPSTLRWLTGIEQSGVSVLPEAPRLAEVAYAGGQFDLARRWLDRSPANDPLALWISGKLALLEGRTAEAERLLARAAPGYPRPFSQAVRIFQPESNYHTESAVLAAYRLSQFHGDLGAAQLGNNHFFPALSSLYRGGYFDDAAYISERLLSASELAAYTRKTFPHWLPIPSVPSPIQEIDPTNRARYLLGRRLARMHYFRDARSFMPPELLPIFDRFVQFYRDGYSGRVSRADRAQALWAAAQIQYSLGMELFGAEGFPDNAADMGAFPAIPYHYERFDLTFLSKPLYENVTRPRPVIPRPTADERVRLLQNSLPNEHRFHYRFAAADLAWQAAVLMPGHSEETARVLGIAGSWIKYQDPQAADRFYKALIWRNWSTPLAREADARRWFPDIPWDYEPFQANGLTRPESITGSRYFY